MRMEDGSKSVEMGRSACWGIRTKALGVDVEVDVECPEDRKRTTAPLAPLVFVSLPNVTTTVVPCAQDAAKEGSQLATGDTASRLGALEDVVEAATTVAEKICRKLRPHITMNHRIGLNEASCFILCWF